MNVENTLIHEKMTTVSFCPEKPTPPSPNVKVAENGFSDRK